MAEGLLRAFAGDRLEVHSAGTEPSRVHPLAIRVMDEAGIDLRGHSSKTLEPFLRERPSARRKSGSPSFDECATPSRRACAPGSPRRRVTR
jgi:hypothetical protein